MASAGISTLGIRFGFNVGKEKPTTMKQLTRINSIGEMSLSTEQIDASALEDFVTRYVAGRQDTGGGFDVVVNLTPETQAEWKALIDEYDAMEDGEEMWFETWSPYLNDGFWVKAQPPKIFPQPASDQNGLWTVTMNLTVTEYVGLDTAVEPKAGE